MSPAHSSPPDAAPVRPVLEAAGLTKTFRVRPDRPGGKVRHVHAVSGVSLRLQPGTTLGVVGESGCGKSTVARLLMRLIDPDAGSLMVDGSVAGSGRAAMRSYRRDVQMVFQDSSASLNPRLTIEASIMFAPVVNGVSRGEARERAHELLARVGLDPRVHAGRYPHQLSGGQRQRVNIARALALRPRVVILDEAVSALDKSVEAQVLNLLQDLKTDYGLSYIFISHDLAVIRHICDDVLVMYLGEVVEQGPVAEIYANPLHPYTRALLSSMPSHDPAARTLVPPLHGDPPSPIDLPPGCRFAPRCPRVAPVCQLKAPDLTRRTAHTAACHLTDPSSGHPALEGAAA